MRQCRWQLTLLFLIAATGAFAQSPQRGKFWEQAISMKSQLPWTTSKLCVQYTSPSSKVYTGAGFWDSRGATDTYKIRAAFNEVGTWQWTLLGDAGCIGLGSINGPLSGSVVVQSYTGSLPLYANGPIRVSANGRNLVYSGNSSAFHWIGDTSWGGPHAAPFATWSTSYTPNRQTKGYTAIQVSVPVGKGRIENADNHLEPFYDPADPNGTACDTGPLPRNTCFPRPEFWSEWDKHIEDINAKGMLASIIGLYKRTDENDMPPPPKAWPTLDDSKGYARFVAARVAGYYTTLAPGFDEVPNVPVGDFTTNCTNTQAGTENQACRAREVGTAIKQAVLLETTINASPRIGNPLSALVTHHIGGGCPNGGDGDTCVVDQWLAQFENESWLDFNLVQSGQGLNCVNTMVQEGCISKRASARMLKLYNTAPVKPVINGEAIYDNDGKQKCGVTNDQYRELRGRQAAFNTLLSGGAGFTHGVGGTWDWGGGYTCVPGGLNYGLTAASSTQIGKLKAAFSTLPWQRLVPDCQQWGQPCTDVKNNEQANAAWQFKRMYAYDSSGVFAVAFLPVGVNDSSLKLNLDNLPGFTAGLPWKSVWYNPRSNCTCNANAINSGGTTWSFNRPNSTVDWGLILRNTNSIPSLGVAACTLGSDCP